MRKTFQQNEKMLQNVIRQRDRYKQMYEQASGTTDSMSFNERMDIDSEPNIRHSRIENQDYVKELQKKLTNTELKLKQMTEEFETYKKEKGSYVKLLQEDIDVLRKEAEHASNERCKLSNQLDSTNERFHLLQLNVSAHKSQIKSLQEKCNNFSITIGIYKFDIFDK